MNRDICQRSVITGATQLRSRVAGPPEALMQLLGGQHHSRGAFRLAPARLSPMPRAAGCGVDGGRSRQRGSRVPEAAAGAAVGLAEEG